MEGRAYCTAVHRGPVWQARMEMKSNLRPSTSESWGYCVSTKSSIEICQVKFWLYVKFWNLCQLWGNFVLVDWKDGLFFLNHEISWHKSHLPIWLIHPKSFRELNRSMIKSQWEKSARMKGNEVGSDPALISPLHWTSNFISHFKISLPTMHFSTSCRYAAFKKTLKMSQS